MREMEKHKDLLSFLPADCEHSSVKTQFCISLPLDNLTVFQIMQQSFFNAPVCVSSSGCFFSFPPDFASISSSFFKFSFSVYLTEVDRDHDLVQYFFIFNCFFWVHSVSLFLSVDMGARRSNVWKRMCTLYSWL